MEYTDSKRICLKQGESLRFEIPQDLYLKGVEVIAYHYDLTPVDLSLIDIHISKYEIDGIYYLRLEIQSYPLSLDGSEIEIRVLGSYSTTKVKFEHVGYTDEFILDWA